MNIQFFFSIVSIFSTAVYLLCEILFHIIPRAELFISIVQCIYFIILWQIVSHEFVFSCKIVDVEIRKLATGCQGNPLKTL